MEKPISENYSGPWRLIWLFIAVIFGLMILGSLAIRDWDSLRQLILGVLLVVVFSAIFQIISRRGRVKWFLDNDGLKRSFMSGEQEFVGWEEIQELKYLNNFGLIIRWRRRSANRQGKESYQRVRSSLSIERSEANEIINLWTNRGIASPQQSFPKKSNLTKFYILQGGKLMVAGIVGIFLIITEIVLKKWETAALAAVITMAIFFLGIRLMRKNN